MEWKKAPQDFVDFILEKIADRNCDYKKMFRYPAFYVNGKMFIDCTEPTYFCSYRTPTSQA